MKAKKRANGAGSIERLPDGRFRVRIYVGGRRRTLKTFDDVEVARRMLRAFNKERADGVIVAPSRVTLASYGATWLDERELKGSNVRFKVKSIDGERSVWARHVAPSDLAAMPIESIRQPDLDAFLWWLRERQAVRAITRGHGSAREVEIIDTGRGLSRSMQVHALRLVRGCLAAAMRKGLLETNPATGIRIGVGARAPRDLSENWLRENEIDRLLSCSAISDRDRTLFACALGLGLRLGDLKAIEVANVHLDEWVDGEHKPYVAVEVAKSSKNHVVPVMKWLVPRLRAHLKTLPRASKWLFPNREGERYAKFHDFGWSAKLAAGRDRVPSALERAGVKRKIRFHDLRGTTATHLALGTWGRTWSLQEIQHMLAHSDQRVTERYVRRAVDSLAVAARETSGPRFSSVSGPTAGCPALPMTGTDAVVEVPEIVDAPTRNRTWDLSLRKRLLYPAELRERDRRYSTAARSISSGAARGRGPRRASRCRRGRRAR